MRSTLTEKLLPRSADNHYGGAKIALWIFGLIVLMKVGMGLGCIFNGQAAAAGADGIPLDTFGPAGAKAVVTMFALWGLAQLTVGLICILALVRYRSLVPLLLALLLFEHASRKLILYVLPIARVGSPPGFTINLVLFALEILGLGLALWGRQTGPTWPK
jgi:hypothetical protein